MRRLFAATGAAAMMVATLAGCGDQPQTSGQLASRNSLQPPWDAAANPFVVGGWKSGDQASWQAQMTKRAENQNEFARLN